MNTIPSAQTYRNVMEPLVIEEVERQFGKLAPKVVSYLNKTEVIAYALNRLPPLYATSEQGWQQQHNRARKTMNTQIVTAVRQAIAAIQRDPLRSAAPLPLNQNHDAQAALDGLQKLLRIDGLSWANLVDTVERVLIRTTRGEITWQTQSRTVKNSSWQDNRYML
jgi:hypothetical protein